MGLGLREGRNEWLVENRSKVDVYFDIADIVLVERWRTIKILCDLFVSHFMGRDNLNLLDLGCGDATVASYIRDRSPGNNYHLLDGSPRMIERAREKIGVENVTFIHQTFEDYIDSPASDIDYDFVYSSYAIHHVDSVAKEKLFGRIFRDLGMGGLFLNIDVVRPPSERVEMLQFSMWRNWIEEMLVKSERSNEVSKFRNTPEIYKNKGENKPDELRYQLDLLTEVGFVDVDCYYKYGIFAIYGGVKQE
jgi:tRNA (cmo5U34)-methyltransferase